MKIKLNFDVIIQSKHQEKMTRLMQSADLFNSFKIIASYEKLEVTFNELDLTRLPEFLETLKKSYEQTDSKVIFAGSADTLLEIPIAIGELSVISVSDGKKFFILYNFLIKLGYKPICDSKYHILSLTQ